jgi:hypothetical protein
VATVNIRVWSSLLPVASSTLAATLVYSLLLAATGTGAREQTSAQYLVRPLSISMHYRASLTWYLVTYVCMYAFMHLQDRAMASSGAQDARALIAADAAAYIERRGIAVQVDC